MSLSSVGSTFIVTVQTDNEPHYGHSMLTFLITDDTASNINVTDSYQLETGRFIYFLYEVPKDGDFSNYVSAKNANVFYEGTEMQIFNGTVEDLYVDSDASGRGRILVTYIESDFVWNTWFSYSSSTYFSENITKDMPVTVYADPLILTSDPAQGYAFEFWSYEF